MAWIYDLDFQHYVHVIVLFVFSGLRWEVVRFVEIGGFFTINFLFIESPHHQLWITWQKLKYLQVGLSFNSSWILFILYNLFFPDIDDWCFSVKIKMRMS